MTVADKMKDKLKDFCVIWIATPILLTVGILGICFEKAPKTIIFCVTTIYIASLFAEHF